MKPRYSQWHFITYPREDGAEVILPLKTRVGYLDGRAWVECWFDDGETPSTPHKRFPKTFLAWEPDDADLERLGYAGLDAVFDTLEECEPQQLADLISRCPPIPPEQS